LFHQYTQLVSKTITLYIVHTNTNISIVHVTVCYRRNHAAYVTLHGLCYTTWLIVPDGKQPAIFYIDTAVRV